MNRVLVSLACALLLAVAGRPEAQSVTAGPTRSFHMGFTPWPADLTSEGVTTARDFAHAHGDIVSIMFIGGIPWPEAQGDQPFSKDVENSMAYRPPAGKKLFLSISPLNSGRTDLAPYWGVKDNLPLPPPWDKRAMNSPEVKSAYLRFCRRAVKSMRPDYLAIGIELNDLLSHNPAKWRQAKELYRETYTALKAEYPALPVFFTTDVLHYKRLAKEAEATDQEREVAGLMRYSDLFAMSVYPYMSFTVPRPVPADFLEFATKFKKPIAISESGMSSRDVPLKSFKITLTGSMSDQKQFTELLLKTAASENYVFVINFATTDFDKLCDKLPPPTDDLARIWAYTGMQTSDRQPKPALDVWDTYLYARYDPSYAHNSKSSRATKP